MTINDNINNKQQQILTNTYNNSNNNERQQAQQQDHRTNALERGQALVDEVLKLQRLDEVRVPDQALVLDGQVLRLLHDRLHLRNALLQQLARAVPAEQKYIGELANWRIGELIIDN